MRRPQMEVFFEDLGVTGESLPTTCVSASIPSESHICSSQPKPKHVDGLRNFPVAPQHSRLAGKRGRRSVVRVLGTHNFGY